MLEEDTDATVASDLDQNGQSENTGPKPWQRFLMVRVVEVTAPAVP